MIRLSCERARAAPPAFSQFPFPSCGPFFHLFSSRFFPGCSFLSLSSLFIQIKIKPRKRRLLSTRSESGTHSVHAPRVLAGNISQHLLLLLCCTPEKRGISKKKYIYNILCYLFLHLAFVNTHTTKRRLRVFSLFSMVSLSHFFFFGVPDTGRADATGRPPPNLA